MSTILKRTTALRKGYKFNIERYSSANEMVQDCKHRPMKSGGWHEPNFNEWSGVKSYEEALDLLSTGYQPIVEAMRVTVKLKATGTGSKISFRNSMVGFAPIVPLALQGVPNNMICNVVKPIKNKVINVYYDMTCNCGVTSEQIINNGKEVLSAILAMEAQGYRFNLYAMQAYCDSNSCDMVTIKVKDASQPFDLKRMSFPLCHTAFFRVIGFDWYSKNPDSTYRCAYGHSLQSEFGENAKKVLQEVLGDNAVLLTGSKILSKGKDYIKEELNDGSKNITK